MRVRQAYSAVVALLCVGLATGSSAAPAKVPQVKDAAGDAVGGRAGTDIVSVLYTTTGKGTGRRYVPQKLVVTMTLAGPVETTGVAYEVQALTDTCGSVLLTFAPGTAYEKQSGWNGWALWDKCKGASGQTFEELKATASGKTVRWEFVLKETPLKVGTVFRDFKGRVDPANPVLQFSHRNTGTEFGLVDVAMGTGPWKLG